MTATTHPTIAAFLTAQLDADEAAARAAIDGPEDDGRWRVQDFGYEGIRIGTAALDERPPDPTLVTEETDHIARHDPARVLAQVAALRRVVEIAERTNGWADVHWGQPTLRALASIWKDAPGFDAGWAE